MNWVDIGIVSAVLVPGLIGLKTGIIRVLFTLGGMGLGVYLALQYYTSVAPLLTVFIQDSGLASAVGFAGVLLATLVVSWILASLLKKVLAVILLGWIDNIAGALTGVALGALVAAFGIFLWSIYSGISGTGTMALESSLLGVFFADLVPSLWSGSLPLVSP